MTRFVDAEAAVLSRFAEMGGFSESFGDGFLRGNGGVEYAVTLQGATLPWPFVQEEALIQVDTRCRVSKQAARDAAYEARDWLLQWRHETPGTSPRVALVSGPFWLPEPDGEPRYVMTVAVTTRAIDAASTEAAHG